MWRLVRAAALIFVVASSPALAVVWPEANHIQSTKSRSPHPTEGVLLVLVPTDLPSSVGACIEYGSTHKPSRRGRIMVTLQIRRNGDFLDDETQGFEIPRTDAPEEWEFSKSYYRGCSQPFGTRLRESDAIVIALSYENLPRLRKKDQFALSAALGIVSVSND